MWFSVCTVFATGGGGGAGVAALAVLSSAFRNVLMRRKRTTTDFFIKPPFACGSAGWPNYNKHSAVSRQSQHSALSIQHSVPDLCPEGHENLCNTEEMEDLKIFLSIPPLL